MLAVLGGYGAAALARWRVGHAGCSAALRRCFFLESVARAVHRQRHDARPRIRRRRRRVSIGRRARRRSTRELARQPPDAVLAELPLGQPDFDLRAMFYSTVHWRPLLNGYSGFFPAALRPAGVALSAMSAPSRDLAGRAAHERRDARDRPRGGVARRRRDAIRPRAAQLGAVELFRDGTDVLLRLPADDAGTPVALLVAGRMSTPAYAANPSPVGISLPKVRMRHSHRCSATSSWSRSSSRSASTASSPTSACHASDSASRRTRSSPR